MEKQDSFNAASRLGTAGVGKLLFQFSIPAITGMLLNALYNVVDRIFVGRGVDEIALGGLSLVLPLMTLTMAFAMLFGIGAANMISVKLGEQRKNDAEQSLNHGFWLLIISSIILIILEFVFFEQILSLLGASSESRALDYARRYYRIILAGTTFFMISFGLSHCTRAQGFPVISMMGMVIGALINTVLDPIFIFILKWGVEGAAYATVISWIFSSAWLLYFSMGRKAVVRLHISPPRFKLAISIAILGFGSAQFLLQFAMSSVQLLFNYSMGWYGAARLGQNGGDIAISAMNIVGTFTMLILMPVFGINQGAQPVLGYNYGAKQFKRVRKAFLGAIGAATLICVFGFLVVEIFPNAIVNIFTSEDKASSAILEWTPWALRVACIMLPLNGFTIVASNMFVVTGRPRTAIFLSLTRQVFALIPAIFIFGKLWGLTGIVWAMPVADFIALLATGICTLFELKKMSVQA
ncbi:MAG: MATE family efflux transporter [Spirochaetaceae bacterium]|jgi:putative MATE family efflux protein|nr:MATE family efflux transporter [Spirochaetaceae bacterium]GMO20188.1 MAG: MATE family efflux transporter [Termitinemataceae bacterium]